MSDRASKMQAPARQGRPIEQDWRGHLLTRETRNGEVLKNISANAVTIFNHDERWEGVIAYNEFRDAVETRRAPPWDAVDASGSIHTGEWSDSDTARAQNWLARNYALDLGSIAVEAAIIVTAEQHRFHPVRSYLTALAWDATPRVSTFLVRYLGCDDSEFVRGVSVRFLISAVARVFKPGAKVDTTLILESQQGRGKSTSIRALAGDEWFFDTPIDFGSKDAYQSLRGKWIGELGELSSLGRADAARVKNFLSAVSDTYRPSFGRRTRDFPRQNIFVGSTNQLEGYLRDETGNRRFWPVRCGTIDVAAIRRDRDQIWAESVALYQAGTAWHVDTSEFAKLAASEQEDRFVEDPWTDKIAAWVNKAPRRLSGVTTGEVLEGAIESRTEKWEKRDQDRVAAILTRLGWERGKQQRIAGDRVRRWRPAGAGGDDVVTPLVTRESGSQISMSPASPADLHIHKGDTGNVCTATAPTKPVVTLVTGDTGGVH